MLGATILAWLVAASAGAVIPDQPDFTMLWNDFQAVTVVNSFALATSPDGLVVLQRDAATGHFEEKTHFFLPAGGIQHKRYGDTLAVRTNADVIYFFDLSGLPDITLLGETDLAQPFLDFALAGDDLYVCKGFDGLWRYRLTDFSAPLFVDSSMLGIHYTKVDVYGSELYVIDDYNGILRYDVSGEDFGAFQDYLFLPFQARSFRISNDTAYVAVYGSRILVGMFAEPAPQIVDTARLLVEPDRVFFADTLAAVFTRSVNLTEIISLNTLQTFVSQINEPLADSLQGDIYMRGGHVFAMLPTAAGGLVEYNVTDRPINPTSTQALARPGPVTDITIQNGMLYAAGGANPPDRFQVQPDGQLVYDTTFFPGITDIAAMAVSFDTMFIMYGGLNRLYLWDIDEPTTPLLGSAIPITDSVRTIVLHESPVDTVRCFMAIGTRSLDMIGISDSGIVLPRLQVEVLDEIAAATVKDSVLFVGSRKIGVAMYRVYDNFDFEYRGSFSLGFPVNTFLPRGDDLWVFAGRELIVYSAPKPPQLAFDTAITMPHRATDIAIDGNLLYTVGISGMAVYDLSSSLPTLIDEGGRPGDLIAAHNGVVVVSNGRSIHSYNLFNLKAGLVDKDISLPESVTLAQNYPNPFNPTTTISFALDLQADVKLTVYNVLGQRVQVLLDEEIPAGSYSVDWDGRDAAGNPVSTGVYFYRLEAGESTESRKMLLLK
jgi:hypothetical protein